MYPSTSVDNIYGHWLDGISNRFCTLIRVGAFALLWSWLCPCRNDINGKTPSALQVICHCMHLLRMWSMLHRVEYEVLKTVYYEVGASGQGGFY